MEFSLCIKLFGAFSELATTGRFAYFNTTFTGIIIILSTSYSRPANKLLLLTIPRRLTCTSLSCQSFSLFCFVLAALYSKGISTSEFISLNPACNHNFLMTENNFSRSSGRNKPVLFTVSPTLLYLYQSQERFCHLFFSQTACHLG